jgi:hypothetical protein
VLKVSLVRGRGEQVGGVWPLFGPSDAVFEKVAAPSLLGEVARYIEALRPRPDSQYELVCAMGAGEYYGSNVNGDHFSEAGLIHRPDDWTGNPLIDAVRSEKWRYGFPTFYSAQVYAHHRNNDASRGFGAVELCAYNPEMRRVELVCRLDRDRCQAFGGQAVWDRLKSGDFPDVSMGTKVPFDGCSICLDTALYEEGRASFDPGRHRTPADAILELHKKKKERDGVGIRGLSITRRDYCEHARYMMNRILPDGRKVWVYNDFPRFFDISFVFIGADKIAKSMMKIADEGRRLYTFGWSDPALGAITRERERQGAGEKTASERPPRTVSLGKNARAKESAIEKNVVPSQFARQAIPLLTAAERPLPADVSGALERCALEAALSTLSVLGIVLRPSEFQRLVLVGSGKAELARELEHLRLLFPKAERSERVNLSESMFEPLVARRLSPLLPERSGLGPMIEARAVIALGAPRREPTPSTEHASPLLQKVGALYRGYREALIDLVDKSPDMLAKAAEFSDARLHELRCAERSELLTPLSMAYFARAYRG